MEDRRRMGPGLRLSRQGQCGIARNATPPLRDRADRLGQRMGCPMIFLNLNPWAILVAAASAFLLGGLWYSQILFGPIWKKANRFGVGEPAPPTGKTFAISFVLSLVMATNLAMFLNDPKTNLAW